MSLNPRYLQITDELINYISDISLRESEALRGLREETTTQKSRLMQSSPDQAQFIAFLASLIEAKNIIEIGVYKGYTTLALAEILAENGKIIACEENQEYAHIAQKNWAKAKQDHKINLKIAKAEQTLLSLIKDGATSSFDLIFIDADKMNYSLYYELSLELVRPKGLIIIDNTLWYGNVINKKINDPDTISIREFNEKLKTDARINITLLPIRDGLTLAQKK